MMEEENRKILEFAQKQQHRESERMAAKQEKEEAMSAVQQKVRGLPILFSLTIKSRDINVSQNDRYDNHHNNERN